MSLFKLTATLGLNTSDYEKNVKRAGRSAKTLGGALKNAGQGALATRNRIKQLSAEYAAANTSVAALSAAYNKSVKETGLTSDATRELGEKLKAAQEKAAGLKSELDGLTASSRKTSQKFKEFGKNAAAFTGKAIGGGVKLLAKGTAMAATAIGTLVSGAVKNYSEYEQLVGGVETLFGESATKVKAYAQGAYQTAGMSANDYMETVTSFSASLLQSLDGDTNAAADKANMALTDMSDNANKMGTDIDSIKNAYQGFARGNFMMLDNLHIGYQGTREEMERLLVDAEKISGVKYDISNYADMVDAIHVIQTEMNISGLSAEEAAEAVASGAMTQEEAFEAMGTTAKEASTTIQGSWGMVKSSFQNLLTSIAGGGPAVQVTMKQLADSVSTFMTNLLPVISTALQGAVQLITQLGPQIAAALPGIAAAVLPQLAVAAVTTVNTFLSSMLENHDQIMDTAFQILTTLIEGLIEGLPMLLELATQLIVDFCNKITENPEQAVDAALKLVTALLSGLIQALPQLVAAAAKMVAALIGALVEKAPDILAAGVDLLGKLVEGIEESLESLVEAGKSIVNSVKEGISAAWDGLTEWFNGIWDSLFKNRKVDVTVEKHESGAKKAGGMSYVPYNGMPAILHRGEAILTARQAEEWRRGQSNQGQQGFTLVQNINAVPQTPVELAAASRAYLEQARWAVAL